MPQQPQAAYASRPGDQDIDEAREVFDGTGLTCVRLLLALRRRLSALPPGTQVDVVTSDPTSVYDLPAWCHLSGHVHHGYQHHGSAYWHHISVTERSDRRTEGHVWGARLGRTT